MTTKAKLDDLPKYSPWPARLMGLEVWKQRYKTPEEITREYEHEKWGVLLKKVTKSNKPVTVKDVNNWSFSNTPDMFCSLGKSFRLMRPLDAHVYYLKLIKSVLKQYMPASALVELGAGYGNIILTLAGEKIFSGLRIMAAEYTKAGADLIRRLSDAAKFDVTIGRCDFSARPITDLPVPKRAIIFTSFATPYVPNMPVSFIRQLKSFDPKAVVHFEPCYEHYDPNTVIGLMRKRYIEVNDYNRNLVTLLHEQQSKKQISIFFEKPAFFGSNPLLPASVIAWTPLKK